ncbi:MAG: AMP-binding protein [Desulfobacterales bacterium]
MTHNMTEYDQTYARFTLEVPEYYNFAADVIERWALDPDKTAMLWLDDEGREVRKTFDDISRASKRLANALKKRGVKKKDVVMLILPRNIEWWEALTACIRMGAIAAPGTTQLSPKDLEYRANAANAACIITNHEIGAKFETVADRCPSVKNKIIISEPRDKWLFYDDEKAAASDEFKPVKTKSQDPCLVYFTSGTVGNPKMALHTHASYPIGHQVTGRFWLDLTPDDLHWNLTDTGWAKAAWSSYFGPWSCGAAIFVHHSERFDPTRTLQLLEKYPITTLCGSPTLYRMLVLKEVHTFQFSALRHCVGAGEPLNPEIIEVWKADTGLTIRDGYGQTETTLLVANFPCIEPRFGSMGKPSPGFEVRVVDDEGNILPSNTEGNIAIRVKPHRPVGLFKEYWGEPDRTASVFLGDWYLTGDRARVDEDGYFWFIGRSDDVILSSGYRIGPFEVESALIRHPAVAESAVVSSPDAIRGEVVKAFVVLTPEYKPSDDLIKELQEHVKKETAPYKHPRKIEFVDSLPKTVSGKIRRFTLRNREWSRM